MTLSLRLVITVLSSVGIAIVGVAVIIALEARNALIDQAEDRARLIAGLIAAETNRAEVFLAQVDDAFVEEIEAQAVAVAYLAETMNRPDLAGVLAEITSASVIDDIWVLDRLGRPIARAVAGFADPEVHLSDLEGAGIDPRELAPLLAGSRFAVSLRSNPASALERPLRYVGVRLRAGRFALVGTASADIAETSSASQVAATLAQQEATEAVWVLDERLEIIAMAGNVGEEDATLSASKRTLAQRALHTVAADREGGAFSSLAESGLDVAAPILDRGGIATGVVVMLLPRDRLDRLLEEVTYLSAIAAAVAFVIGSIIAIVSSRRIARPVIALTRAAEEMDRKTFAPSSLDPVSERRDELGNLVRVFQSMAREVQLREEHLEGLVRERTADLQEKNEQLEAARRRVDEELRIARMLQGAILPRSFPQHDAYIGAAMMTPAQELGGDFYDSFTLPDGRLGVIMADVSGKGVPAAFFMAISRTVTRQAALEHSRPGPCMRAINDTICTQNPHDLFVTMFYGILDPANGRFDYANAGHNAPFLIGASGGVTELAATGGVVVGVMPDLDYDERSVALAPGDTLFLYTDGISEAMNRAGESFDEARLESTLAMTPAAPIDAVTDNVMGALGNFVGDAPQSDDITCLVLRYLGAGADA